ncbi:MAG TPA: DUF5686 and carboxypeptidase regulatory-like domain-containing protein [Puia sp.]|nr:DUF5686 and carboxypeptidase regulatory-like domain-containing protein [Puia sp.]
MKRTLLLFLLHIGTFLTSYAARISGTVTDDKGNILPYSSILVKGTTRGVTANHQGKYYLDLAPGAYTLTCQYVGYTRVEKKITVTEENQVVNFQLSLQQLSMPDVVVRPGGEDPAYAIIRHAIRKRKDYEAPLDSFTCEAYIKTQIRTRRLPGKILGKKLEDADRKQMGVDSVGAGMIYLSESLTNIAFKKPNKVKLEVISGRESGSNGYGFSLPTFINFYNSNVTVFAEQLNPRGYISPIAESALNYYHYKYLGSFFEDGKEINKIQVIPRRKYEPLFSGTINIVDGEWRIHSLDLLLVKTSLLEVLDTLQIRQIHVPVNEKIWQVKDQVVYFSFNQFGIDAVGNFLNVYSKYQEAPRFRKKYFNNVLMKFDSAANKRTKAYWDSIRPVQLEPDEQVDYRVKDSIYEYNRDSMGTKKNRDSLLKQQGPVTVGQVVWGGFSRSDFRKPFPFRYTLEGLLPDMGYNTVEGLNMNVVGTLAKSLNSNTELILSPHLRYGFHNTHLNAWGTLSLVKRPTLYQPRRQNDNSPRKDRSPGGKKLDEDDAPVGGGFYASSQTWAFSGGKRVSQFNPANPISDYLNDFYTLFIRRNYMKIYENYFAEIKTDRRYDNGLRIAANALYEDRIPLDNTTSFSIINVKGREFTPNYPFEKIPSPFTRHQAFLTGVNLQFQPGQRYVEFPDRRLSLGSKFPTFSLFYQKGWQGILGSDVNFDKWQFSVWDDANFKLRGLLRYRFSIGGFLNTNSVFIQDYQHFSGNQTIFASEYLNSFQIAPYYANSTTANFYATGHLEHHFNGFLTNKIPLFKRLNWHLVGGSNAFYVNRNNNYVEVFGGLENIFKLLRVDLVGSYLNGHYNQTGIRIGLGGLLGGMVQTR